jgi:hypothetical protein
MCETKKAKPINVNNCLLILWMNYYDGYFSCIFYTAMQAVSINILHVLNHLCFSLVNTGGIHLWSSIVVEVWSYKTVHLVIDVINEWIHILTCLAIFINFVSWKLFKEPISLRLMDVNFYKHLLHIFYNLHKSHFVMRSYQVYSNQCFCKYRVEA